MRDEAAYLSENPQFFHSCGKGWAVEKREASLAQLEELGRGFEAEILNFKFNRKNAGRHPANFRIFHLKSEI